METIKTIVGKVVNPSFLIIFSFVIILIGRFFFKVRYTECIDILKGHFQCMKRKKDGKLSKVAIIIYYIVPFIIACALALVRVIDNDVINVITVIISILTAMLFTVLTLILDLKAKVNGNPQYNANDAKLIKNVLRETYYSIMFELFISVILLIFCFVDLFSKSFSVIESIILYYMTLVVFVNLLIILKSIFKVIENEMK